MPQVGTIGPPPHGNERDAAAVSHAAAPGCCWGGVLPGPPPASGNTNCSVVDRASFLVRVHVGRVRAAGGAARSVFAPPGPKARSSS